MTCSHCEESVEKTLSKISGINNVKADAKNNIVSIDSSNVSFDDIANAINKLGFKIKNEN